MLFRALSMAKLSIWAYIVLALSVLVSEPTKEFILHRFGNNWLAVADTCDGFHEYIVSRQRVPNGPEPNKRLYVAFEYMKSIIHIGRVPGQVIPHR
jgi:hypothetical protein